MQQLKSFTQYLTLTLLNLLVSIGTLSVTYLEAPFGVLEQLTSEVQYLPQSGGEDVHLKHFVAEEISEEDTTESEWEVDNHASGILEEPSSLGLVAQGGHNRLASIHLFEGPVVPLYILYEDYRL